MKKYLVACILVVCAATAHAQQMNGQQQTLDKIVAVVDKEAITLSDLIFSVQQYAVQNKLDPASPEIQSRVLDGMINDKLILAQAIEDSVVVTDEEVADRLERQLNMLIQRVGSKEKLEEVYGMPLTRIRRDFQYREMIRKQLLIEKVQQARNAALTVSRREVVEFFETYRDSIPKVPTEYELSHIYIQPKPDSTVIHATYERALAMIDSVKAGVDFADLAKRYSIDPGSASQGGDLGWVRRGLFVKEFEEAAFALKDKEISKPVKTQFGYHIIQLLERRGESVHPRHILLPIEQSKANDDSTIAFLNRLRERPDAKETFAVMAKKYSEDNDTKDIGGDLGKVALDQIDPSYVDVVTAAKSGEITAPAKLTVGSKYGYHIIYVRSIVPEHIINLDADYHRLEQLALQMKTAAQYQKWVEEMRKNIYWEKKL
jgi:peptidyl-prolyl cis-trans isomerase SurA